MKRALEFVMVTALGYAVMELYIALRPADLTDQLTEWLDTAHGRFETFYAEWRQHDRRTERNGSAPLGE